MIECLRLDKIMQQNSCSYIGAVKIVLLKCGADELATDQLLAAVPHETEIQFDEILALVKDA